MGTFSDQPDPHPDRGAGEGACSHKNLSGSLAGDIMKGKYQVRREAFEFRVMNDPQGPFAGFFGRLKEKDRPSATRGLSMQQDAQTGQNRHVTVMPAFMRNARLEGTVLHGGCFMNRKGIQLRPQHNGRSL
jgi:hypothetical protein